MSELTRDALIEIANNSALASKVLKNEMYPKAVTNCDKAGVVIEREYKGKVLVIGMKAPKTITSDLAFAANQQRSVFLAIKEVVDGEEIFTERIHWGMFDTEDIDEWKLCAEQAEGIEELSDKLGENDRFEIPYVHMAFVRYPENYLIKDENGKERLNKNGRVIGSNLDVVVRGKNGRDMQALIRRQIEDRVKDFPSGTGASGTPFVEKGPAEKPVETAKP